VPRKQPTPKAAKPKLVELDFEDEEPSGLGILDDDGNMVLRRSAKPKPKGKARGKGKDKPAR
jgi:hypothetical protein